jgi:tRNA1(Val) A37 N6-methylase TrmN6
MVLIEAVKGGRPGVKVEAPLVVYTSDGAPTTEMRQIYGAKESDDDTWPEDENR